MHIIVILDAFHFSEIALWLSVKIHLLIYMTSFVLRHRDVKNNKKKFVYYFFLFFAVFYGKKNTCIEKALFNTERNLIISRYQDGKMRLNCFWNDIVCSFLLACLLSSSFSFSLLSLALSLSLLLSFSLSFFHGRHFNESLANFIISPAVEQYFYPNILFFCFAYFLWLIF